MRSRSLFNVSLALLMALLVTACGSGGGGDGGTAAPAQPATEATVEMVVTPSLGKTVGAGAQAIDPAGNPLSDEVDTTSSGFATLSIPAAYGGPVIIRIRGKAGARYFDEATGQDEDFPEGMEIRAGAPAPVGAVGVSILTELAVRLAEASGEEIDSDAISAANERIRAALAPDVADLLTPPAVVDGDTGAGALGSTDAGKLAARLGALANLANMDATPALTILQQLSADVADGVIDALDADGNAIMTVYAPASFATDFVRAIQDFAAAFGNEDLQTTAASARAAADVGNAGSGGSAPGAGFDTEAGTVNDGLVGEYTLVYFDSDAAGRDPFSNDEQISASIGADNTLTVGDIGPLSGPFLQSGPAGGAVNTAELIWEDPATGLLYAVSNNDTGVFNEINVGDPQNPQQSGFAGFVGQLTEVVAEAPAGPAGACGTGSGTSLVSNCAGTYTVTATTAGAHTRGTVVIGSDGSVDFDDGISFTAAQIQEVFDRLSLTEDARIQINYGADDDADVIILRPNADRTGIIGIEYRNRGAGSDVKVDVSLQS